MATDPRVAPDRPVATERGVMPIVARPRGELPVWAMAIVVGLAALLLFLVLNARRQALEVAATEPRTVDAARLPAPPPPLVIPLPAAEPTPVLLPISPPVPPRQVLPILPPSAPTLPEPRSTFVPLPVPPVPVPLPPPPRASGGGSALVIDNTTGRPALPPGALVNPANLPGGVTSTDRVRAGTFANRETTVVQGTLIPAVLETAFDSTRAGFARAVVQRNVLGFDGVRVLIPRGSRLIGEYRSDAAPGHKRALVIWNRLIRPDGTEIALGSPAADELGRSGVAAQVNTHFLERFSGAILQSALDVGVNIASRSGNGTVVYALPGSVQNTTGQLFNQGPIQPTLKVRAGSSISVFVARDLDFTDVENRR